MLTKHELRKKYLHKLIGREVRVRKIRDGNPKREDYKGIVVPLPEYGIALWSPDAAKV